MSIRRRSLDDDPAFVDLRERVARLEERTVSLEKIMASLKEKIESVDSRTWYILTGVILSILIQIALRLMH